MFSRASLALRRGATRLVHQKRCISNTLIQCNASKLLFRALSTESLAAPEQPVAADSRFLQIEDFNIMEDGDAAEAQVDKPLSWEDAQSLFDKLLSEKAEASAFLPVFRTLNFERRFTESVEFFYKLKEANYDIPPAIYRMTLMSAFWSLPHYEVRQLWGEPHPSHARNPKSDLFDSCEELTKMMIEEGKDDAEFYDAIAKNCRKGNYGGHLLSISQALLKRGVSVSTYFNNNLLAALNRMGRQDLAGSLFARMVLDKSANPVTMATRMYSLTNMGQISQALAIFNQLKESNQLTPIACNVMIRGYLRAKDVKSALEILSMMQNTPNLQPTASTADSFINFYLSSNDMGSSIEVVPYFLNNTEYPKNPRHYGSLLRYFARVHPARAREMVQKFMESEVQGSHMAMKTAMFNAMVSVVTDRNVLEPVVQCIAEVVGSVPIATEPVLKLTESCKFHEPLYKVLALMEDAGCRPDEQIYSAVLIFLQRQQKWSFMVQVGEEYFATRPPVTNRTINPYLQGLLHVDPQDMKVSACLAQMVTAKATLSFYNVTLLNKNNILIDPRIAPVGSK